MKNKLVYTVIFLFVSIGVLVYSLVGIMIDSQYPATSAPYDPLQEMLRKATLGDPNSQCMLGQWYAHGIRVSKNYEEAMKWYTRASDQGDALASYQLGEIYANGHGVPRNYKEAIQWYTRAAEQGHTHSQYMMGDIYAKGKDVPQDYKEAIKWYTKAAEQGDDISQYNLGVYYSKGQGVPQDYKESLKWYTMAAEQDFVLAQYDLGLMYGDGLGAQQNYIEAYKWLYLTAEHQDSLAIERCGFLRKLMSQDQITEAQRLIKDFKSKIKATDAAAALTLEKIAKAEVKSFGTGFFITTDGYLLTAYHVIKEASSIQIWTDKEADSAKVVRVDANNDIALLKIDGMRVIRAEPMRDVTSLTLCSLDFDALAVQPSQNVKIGQEFSIFGFQTIPFREVAAKGIQGNITHLNDTDDNPQLFQISTAIQPGILGGPILDADGQVMGLVISKPKEIALVQNNGPIPRNDNYVLKSSNILSFLESVPEMNGKLLHREEDGLNRIQLKGDVSKAVVLVLCY